MNYQDFSDEQRRRFTEKAGAEDFDPDLLVPRPVKPRPPVRRFALTHLLKAIPTAVGGFLLGWGAQHHYPAVWIAAVVLLAASLFGSYQDRFRL